MLIQLFLVSSIYLLFDLPYVIIFIIRQIGFPNFGENVLSPYIMRLTYLPAISLPYATLIGISRLKQKLRSLLFWKRNTQRIVPINIK